MQKKVLYLALSCARGGERERGTEEEANTLKSKQIIEFIQNECE